jgi:hypothetical protein
MAEAVEPGGITHFRALVDTMDRAQTIPEVMRTSRVNTRSSCEGKLLFFGVYSHIDSLFRYFEVQIEIGENVQGWVFWTWKVRSIFFLTPCIH